MAASVFLHSGWRTAGTWMWSLLRRDPNVTAFYEPFNEVLGLLSIDEMVRRTPDSWASGHPAGRPYFEEFAPLFSRNRRGVAGYRPAFAIGEFFARAGASLGEQESYLRSLSALAQGRGRVAVMKFARSMGRVGWLHATFPEAVHAVILRNPWDQWVSGWRLFFHHGDPLFVTMPFVILTRHRTHPGLARASEIFELHLPDFEARELYERYAICVQGVLRTPLEVLYRAFLAVWTVTAIDALEHADLSIDIDDLASSPPYRREIERRFTSLCGLELDLASARDAARAHPPPDFGGYTLDVERCHALATELATTLERPTGDVVRHKLRSSVPSVILAR